MSKLKFWLDMDGVICDFHLKYQQIKGDPEWCDVKFHQLVLEHQIFRNLEWMPNGKKLADKLLGWYDSGVIDLEILSSCGTWNVKVAPHSAYQKTHWLNDKGLGYIKKTFVHSFACKKNYATPDSVLIDDREDCCKEFAEAGGLSILYNDNKTESGLNTCVQLIQEHQALCQLTASSTERLARSLSTS